MHHWIHDYGYFGIFALLVLGIVGVPVPDETLLAFSGFLSQTGELRLVPTIAAAFLGSSCGITVSYLLGRGFGHVLVKKFGRRIHLTEERVEKVHGWFRKLGRWTLLIGYYVPGVRHATAFVAGASRLEYGSFAAFAYSGALAWTNTFVLGGYFLGREWHRMGRHIPVFIVAAAALLALAAGVAFLLWRKKRQGKTASG